MDKNRILTLLLAPVFLAFLCMTLGRVVPTEEVWGAVLQALLLSAPRWLMLLYPIGSIYSLARRAMKDKQSEPQGMTLPAKVAVAIFGIVAAGNPFSGTNRGTIDGFTVMSANVQAFTDGARELEAFVGEIGVDLFLQIEMRAIEVPGMTKVSDNYNTGLAIPSHGMGIYCSEDIDCVGEVTENFGTATCGMPMSLVRVNSEVCVMGLHVPPPAPFCALGVEPYVTEMLRYIDDGLISQDWGPCQAGDPIVVAGDLNGVPGGYGYRALIDSGLNDPQAGAGIWASTWPAGGGWPNLPVFRLDHVFSGQGVTVSGISRKSLPKSDHKALIFSIGVQ